MKWNRFPAICFLASGLIGFAANGAEFTTLASFAGTNGANPMSGLVLGPDGAIYGTTFQGGANGWGSVFRISQFVPLTTVYSFTNGLDGAYPVAGLTVGSDGNFYGATYDGGTNNDGTIFKLALNGTLTTLHFFGTTTNAGGFSADGAHPPGSLIQFSDGTLYGTTQFGGTNNAGTLFKITTNGALTTLAQFGAMTNVLGVASNGANPEARLWLATDGNFYGTTASAGTNGTGSIFRISPSGTFAWSVALSASNAPIGFGVVGAEVVYNGPRGGVTQGSDGNLYGMTFQGGTNGSGSIFQVSMSGALATIYSFGATATNGAAPFTDLALGAAGTFYGTTQFGGTSNQGTLFAVTTSGAFTNWHSFSGFDGAFPSGAVAQDASGNFYGTTFAGGASGQGTIFLFNTSSLPPPGIASASPSVGPIAGGTTVTILGTNFQSGATVSFGGIAAASVTVNNSTNITAASPAQGAGLVNVIVANPDGQAVALTNGFDYQATPTVSWTAPAAITYGTALGAAQLNASATVAGAFAYSPAAGTVPNAGTATLTVVFTPQNTVDYTSVTSSVSLAVSPAQLIITPNNATRQYGQSNPAFTGSITGLQNGDNITATYASSATASSATGTYSIVPTLSDPNNRLGNYAVTTNNGSLSVTTAPLTVTANNATRQYGQSNPAFTGSITGLQNGDNITATYSSSAAASSVVGLYSIVPTLSDPNNRLGNYSVTTNNGSLTVTTAPLTVSANNATRQYGQSNPAFTGSITGLQNGDNITATYASSATVSSAIGSYSIVPTLSDPNNRLGNYAVTTNNGSLSVTTAPLTVTGNNATRQYGQSNPAFTGSITGLQNGDNITATYASSATAASAIGSYSIVPTLSDPNSRLGNYSVTTNNGSLTVTTAPLTVTANNATRQYGQSNPTFTGSITGLQNGDNITATYASSATPSSAVGSYSIVPTLSDPNSRLANYSVTTNNGSLTVTTTPLTVTASNATRQYGQSNPTFTGSIAGLKNGDNITATYASSATPSSPVGAYSIVPTLSDPNSRLGNYSVTTNNGSLTVTTASLTVTANNATRQYGQSNPTFTGSITGVQNGDNITATYASSATAASAIGSYSIVPTLSDPNNRLGNYAVTTNNGSLSVTTAPLTVTGNNATRQYGQSNPAFTGSITGLQNGDNITATYASSATTSSTIGTYSIVPTLSDPNNRLGNYSVTTNNGSLTVTTTPLTVSANNATRQYGQSNPAFTGSITGLQNGDNITATYSSSASASSDVGSYAIVPTLSDPNNRLGNYALIINDGTLTIIPVAIMGLTGISPAIGPTNGGTVVAILGTNFLTGATVNFGLLPATSVSVNSVSNMTAITPAQGAGLVNVVVTNADGQVAVLTNGFTYGISPYIITQPAPQAAAVAGNVTLSLVAGGSIPLSYQWLLNSVDLPNATNAALALTNLQAPNAGFYAAVVSNLYGITNSSPASVSVLGVPVSFAADPAAIVNGQIDIVLDNLTGQGTVVIQASTNLVQWVPIFTNPPAFGQVQFTNAMTNSLIRFYKAVVTPPQ